MSTITKKFSRRDMLRTTAVGAGTLAAWPLIRTAKAATPEYTMIFGDLFTDNTEKYIVTGLNHFKMLAEKYSDGKLRIDLHRGGSVGDQQILPQKILQGAVHGCQTSTQNFTPYSEAYNVLDLPFLFPNSTAVSNLLQDPATEQTALFTDPEKKGFKVVNGMWTNVGFRWLGVSKHSGKVVRGPTDLDGVRVRVTKSKVEQKAFALTPASPVQVNPAEIYTSMQQGTADALNVGIGPITALRLHEVLGAATDLRMSLNAHVTVIGLKWFESLPGTVQDAIDQAGRETFAYQQKLQAKANERMLKEWQEMGIELVEPTDDERAQWLEQCGHQRPEWAEWRERVGADLYQHVQKFSVDG